MRITCTKDKGLSIYKSKSVDYQCNKISVDKSNKRGDSSKDSTVSRRHSTTTWQRQKSKSTRMSNSSSPNGNSNSTKINNLSNTSNNNCNRSLVN